MLITYKSMFFDSLLTNLQVCPRPKHRDGKLLLEQGVGPEGVLNDPRFTVLHSITREYWYRAKKHQSSIPAMRTLLHHLDTQEIPQKKIVSDILEYFTGTSEAFRFLQWRCCPFFYGSPLNIRINVAVGAAKRGSLSSTRLNSFEIS
jgi:hypothetical protein